jgi:cell wall-associated NlpC family hydrolase
MGRPVAEAPAAEAAPPPAAEPAPPPAPRTSRNSRAIVETAMKLRGVPYRFGGSDPKKGFDCSGFTRYVFAKHGIDLSRTTIEQSHEGQAIKRREVRAGDLLFFKTEGKEASHVAISIDGDQFVHAPTTNGVVRVESLETTYWSSRFLVARRVR